MRRLIQKHIKITYDQNRFLDGLQGKSVSEHIRIAIDDYMIKKKIEMAHAAFSPSRKGSDIHG